MNLVCFECCVLEVETQNENGGALKRYDSDRDLSTNATLPGAGHGGLSTEPSTRHPSMTSLIPAQGLLNLE
jgi:hypothetical protein